MPDVLGNTQRASFDGGGAGEREQDNTFSGCDYAVELGFRVADEGAEFVNKHEVERQKAGLPALAALPFVSQPWCIEWWLKKERGRRERWVVVYFCRY